MSKAIEPTEFVRQCAAQLASEVVINNSLIQLLSYQFQSRKLVRSGRPRAAYRYSVE